MGRRERRTPHLSHEETGRNSQGKASEVFFLYHCNLLFSLWKRRKKQMMETED
jgi:hypothetical protein